MIISRDYLLYILLVITIICQGKIAAGESDYLDLLNSRNNKPRIDLSAEWTWEGKSEKINLPCVFPDSTQTATISHEFFIPESLENSPLQIWFMGIQGYVKIHVNGNLVGTHYNFNSPFSANIPQEFLYNPGKNIIKIILSRRADAINDLPQFVHLFRQKDILAVTREIFLEWQPECRLNAFDYFMTGEGISYSFEVDFSQSALSQSQKVRLQERVINPNGRVVFSRYEYLTPENKQFQRFIPGNDYLLWSPETPNLYHVDLRIITASGKTFWYQYRIGLRSLNTSANSIQLNGKVLDIRGINLREVYSNDGPNFRIRQKITNDLQNIRNNNFNAIRIPHSIPHPLFAEICDSLGILLFIENWIWRLPAHYFSVDYILQATKIIGDESLEHFHLHPSLTAYGLGHEIASDKPDVQKFILILNEYLKQRFKFLSYTSPLSDKELLQTPPADMYLLNKYDQAVFSFIGDLRKPPSFPAILANVGFAFSDSPDALSQTDQWLYFKDVYKQQLFFSGFFIESFNNWPGNTVAPPEYGTFLNNDFYYTYGIFNEDSIAKEIVYRLKADDILVTLRPQVKKRTNFFSLSVFIASIIFFLIYRRNFRIRENIKRALTHPYGFFVDLRDRRIVSISNSTVMALFTTMIVANVLAAYVYTFRSNLLFDEYISTVLGTAALKIYYYSITDSPVGSLLFFWLFSYALQVFTAMLMKAFNLFSNNKFRFRQSLAVSNWSGAPIIFLIPVSLLSLQIIEIDSLRPVLLIVIFSFIFWYHIRLLKGIRILFMQKILPVIILVILTYGGLLCSFIAFSGTGFNSLSYWLVLTQSTSLF